MPSAYPPRPPYPPPGGDPGESDDALAAGVRGGTDGEVAEATALLIARHWRPAHDYAVICLAGSGPVASMATGTAFHQVFDRLKLGESGTDLRPRLLLAVRETVRLWASAERVSAVLPELRKPAGARGMRAAKGMTPDNRILSEYAYHALPATERCLLWHVEVEGEPVSVPAALLGVDTSMAAAALEGARDKLREGIVRAHRELAPSKECRFYNRLLEVPLRRGGDLLPDVRRHLDACRYCRAAAEQLAQGAGWVGLMLAEAVLGWGARRYHDSRPDRGREEPVRVRGAVKRGAGRRLLDRMPAPARREESGRGRVFGAWGSGGDTQGAAEVLPGDIPPGGAQGVGVFGGGVRRAGRPGRRGRGDVGAGAEAVSGVGEGAFPDPDGVVSGGGGQAFAGFDGAVLAEGGQALGGPDGVVPGGGGRAFAGPDGPVSGGEGQAFGGPGGVVPGGSGRAFSEFGGVMPSGASGLGSRRSFEAGFPGVDGEFDGVGGHASSAGAGRPGAAFAYGGFADPDGESGGDAGADGRPRSRRAAGRARVRGVRGAQGTRRAVRQVGKRSPRALIAGVGIASAGVLTTFLAAGMWSDEGSDPASSTSVSGGGALPGADSLSPTPTQGTQGSVGMSGGPQQTRLRNADLCLEVPVGARAGIALALEVCSSNWAQQWSYEDDGLLRSVAEPALCVDSHADAGVVIANTCADADSPRADDVRYDLTVQGELLPRWDERLPLAAVGDDPGANVAVKVRDGSPSQRWLTDAPRPTPSSFSVNGSTGPSPQQA
ncbi:RICIN domain-containing protein [Streptomyces acidiscabies]|uniref:RICIN domain-containing protein n=1 Tax=Streptomyces acidiscabies TaxID=42234 RepID=UPI000AABE31D|nr:RICIN domain-containing protein [Streptomyces acidiscabies]